MTIIIDRWDKDQAARVSVELIDRITILHIDAGHNTNQDGRYLVCSCGFKATTDAVFDPMFGHILTLRVTRGMAPPVTITDLKSIKAVLEGTHKLWGIAGSQPIAREICDKCGQEI